MRLGRARCVGLGCAVFVILLVGQAFSDAVVPYEPGDTQTFQGTAAHLVNVVCLRTYDSCIFTFNIEVFPSAWKPVYSIRILKADGDPLTPVTWPIGWSVEQLPLAPVASGGSEIVIGTATDPIEPGSQRAGFSISSEYVPLVFEWYPQDEDGTLIGKASVEHLLCPVANEPGTWGAIKAMYR
ncbi:MAG TPA: hypothetical protein VMU02_07620 [bacterium]|nr:hypothetical protein [bacterium]